MGDEMLSRVCELAFDVAKEGHAPAAMKNYLYLAQRPPRAYSVAQRALEEDESFRHRVAERASVETVGEAGYLWLRRPEGWEHHFALLTDAGTGDADRPPMPAPPVTASAPPAPTVDSIESELSSLRDLVDRLADERRNVRSSVSELEEELETRRAENLSMSTRLSALRNELDEVQSAEKSVLAQRDDALRQVTELEAKVAQLSAELDDARTSLQATTSERDGLAADLEIVTAERDQSAAMLAEELSANEAKIDELRSANSQLTDDNAELASRVVVAEQARIDLEAELEEMSDKWQTAARQLAVYSGVNDQLDAAVAERNQLRGQLTDARERLVALRAIAGSGHDQLLTELAGVEQAVAGPTDAAPTTEATATEPEAPSETEFLGEGFFEDDPADVVDQPPAEEPADDALADDALADDEPDLGVEPVDEENIVEDDEPEADEPEADEPVDEHIASDEPADQDEEPEAEASVADQSTVDDEPAVDDAGDRTRINVPDHLGDAVSIARHVVSTPDVVLLIDGDGAASLGWPHLEVSARRSALVEYLGQLTAETGAAADVVFERPVGGEEALPVSRAVRVRIADLPVGESPLFAAVIDGYPREWPIAVVTDQPAISAGADAMQVTHLNNGQLLDLFLYLSTNDDQ